MRLHKLKKFVGFIDLFDILGKSLNKDIFPPTIVDFNKKDLVCMSSWFFHFNIAHLKNTYKKFLWTRSTAALIKKNNIEFSLKIHCCLEFHLKIAILVKAVFVPSKLNNAFHLFK